MSLQFDYVSRKARYSVDPGRLDRKISLLSPCLGRDAAGGVTTDWVSTATVWASQRFESARKVNAADAEKNIEYLVYRIRHRTAINNGWLIQHGGSVFEVVGIEPLGRQHYLDLTVRGIDMDLADIVGALLFESGDVFLMEDSNVFALEGAN